ncbi:MAG: 1-acyl-sn-glycerol-3-phosphate acyltransferase [Sediminibacterium sp.]|nr:1-acyl-sn-glycerol-3-phosphate acyltransferase [Sediminibacterium sp.]
MLYSLVKIMVRLALKIFCRKLSVHNAGLLVQKGPLLIVANHPNSFLDAIIIGSLFKKPVHYLARGDVFKKPMHGILLRLLHMIPVYRMSEGRENIFLNERAFSRSKEILGQNGILLIFIEGICVHKHVLQPFKKGAARIALENAGIQGFGVLPITIAYDSFEEFGKQVNIVICENMPVAKLFPYEEATKNMLHFNKRLFTVINDNILLPVTGGQSGLKGNPVFYLPALLGYFLHVPLYTILSNYVRKKTRGTVFFDSVLFSTLLVVYPLYLLVLFLLLWLLHVSPVICFILLLLHPLTALLAMRVKSKGR